MNDFKEEKVIWEAQIRKEYKKFSKFIGSDQLPKFNIEFVDPTIEDINYGMKVKYSPSPTLKINMGFMIRGNFQAMLFHEFTHLWDNAVLCNNKDEKTKRKILSLYSEYHASQVEFLKFIGCDELNSNKKVAPTDTFKHSGEKHTVQQYFESKIEFLEEVLDKYQTNRSLKTFKSVVNGYMYLLGTKEAYSKHVGPISIPVFNDIFYEQMMMTYFCLSSLEGDRMFEILLKARILLDKTFRNDYKTWKKSSAKGDQS